MRAPPVAGRPTDRLSWLWLAAGALLLPFTALQTELPIAAWLAPALLIRFARTQRAALGLLVVTLANAVALTVASRDIVEWPMVVAIGATFGLAYALPYLADRLLTPRLGGLAGTLVFPAAVTATGLGLSFASPYGSVAAPAYSQYGLLPLMQVVSLTGVWGLTFLVSWFAPVANVVWERGRDPRAARRGAAAFSAVLLAALLFGSARLAFVPPEGPQVRVAALAPDERLPATFSTIELARGTDAQRALARTEATAQQDDMLARTVREARAGAQLVAWSEVGAPVLKEDEAALIDRARAVARQERIHLQMALVVILRSDQHPYGENRAVLVDPTGAVVWDYYKTVHPLADVEIFAPGPGTVPTADTVLGRLATVICYDMDFPALLRQVGRARADLLLAPASDWAPMKYGHAQWATFRAIENGASLVRPTRQGLQIAVDHQGRVLASADSLTTNPSTMVAVVPSRSVWTLYPVIGDLVAYLAVLGLLTLAIAALGLRRPVWAAARTQVTAAR
jgi:apolipoprotein N-acyltransferase